MQFFLDLYYHKAAMKRAPAEFTKVDVNVFCEFHEDVLIFNN